MSTTNYNALLKIFQTTAENICCYALVDTSVGDVQASRLLLLLRFQTTLLLIKYDMVCRLANVTIKKQSVE